MPVGPDGWFDAAPTIPGDGLRARSVRGSIGTQWWSRRFVDILEGVCDPGRLSRGRSYARKGQVLDLSVVPGLMTARVQGSRPAPYRVTVRIESYDAAAWARVEHDLAGRAVYRARLLAGEMPPEIEAVLAALGLPLFPSALDMQCSCPDWGVPCKHLSAALYLLAEAFDDDPFLVLAWRGREREALLEGLRRAAVIDEAPADPAGDEAAGDESAGDEAFAARSAVDRSVVDRLAFHDVPLAERLDDFWSLGAQLPVIDSDPKPDLHRDLLLRAVEPPGVTVRHRPLVDLLRQAYRD
jgi:uncharacterized Zn finger protein